MLPNPYQPPPSLEEELPIGLSPNEALEKHKQEFARQLARQRFVLTLVGISLAIFSALLIVVPLLCAPAILFR